MTTFRKAYRVDRIRGRDDDLSTVFPIYFADNPKQAAYLCLLQLKEANIHVRYIDIAISRFPEADEIAHRSDLNGRSNVAIKREMLRICSGSRSNGYDVAEDS